VLLVSDAAAAVVAAAAAAVVVYPSYPGKGSRYTATVPASKVHNYRLNCELSAAVKPCYFSAQLSQLNAAANASVRSNSNSNSSSNFSPSNQFPVQMATLWAH